MFGFSHSMTEDDVRKTYKKMCLKYHPDSVVKKGGKVTDEVNAIFHNLQNQYEEYMKAAKKNKNVPENKRNDQQEVPKSNPTTRKPSCCSVCGQPGHNRATCPMRKSTTQQTEKPKKNTPPPPPKVVPEPNKKEFNVDEKDPSVFANVVYTFTIEIPKNAKTGDVIKLVYTNINGKKNEYSHIVKDYEENTPYVTIKIFQK